MNQFKIVILIAIALAAGLWGFFTFRSESAEIKLENQKETSIQDQTLQPYQALASGEFVEGEEKIFESFNQNAGKAPAKVSRDNDKLLISYPDQKKLEFADHQSEDPSVVTYQALALFYPSESLLIQYRLWEGGGHKLISLVNGSEAEIESAPLWSPDKKTFLSTNCDESSYTEDAYRIGRCDDHGCRILISTPQAARAARWIQADVVQIELVKLDESQTGDWLTDHWIQCQIHSDTVECRDL